jgi:HlyD family secretion protein
VTRPASQFALALVALSVLAAPLAGCGGKAKVTETEAARARTVRVVRVEPRAILGAVAADGALLPREEVAVLPEVSGYRVARVLVDEGQYVKAGQPLVEIDRALINAQLDQARAQAAQAAVQAEQAEAQSARVKGLDNEGVLSQEAIDQRRFQARAARATANAQAAAARDIVTRAKKLTVTAPVAGLILERNVRPGDLTATGSSPWFRLAKDGEIELKAEMSEVDLGRVRSGQRANVTLTNGATVEGFVRFVSPQLSAQTKLGSVRVHLPVRADIRSGGYGRAQFADAAGQSLAVPETAIRFDADGASVMTVGADNKVKRVMVVTGARGGGLVALTRGPPAGTLVVENAAAFLLDGDQVKPVTGASK